MSKSRNSPPIDIPKSNRRDPLTSGMESEVPSGSHFYLYAKEHKGKVAKPPKHADAECGSFDVLSDDELLMLEPSSSYCPAKLFSSSSGSFNSLPMRHVEVASGEDDSVQFDMELDNDNEKSIAWLTLTS